MSPKVKVALGLILMVPGVGVSLYAVLLAWGNPAMTNTQVSFAVMPYGLIASIPFIAGAVLLATGKEENDAVD